MRFCSIASGSSGNCIYVAHASTHLLVDAGVSGKRIEEGLLQIGVNPKELSGILVTHEHSDHVQGIGVLARKYGIKSAMPMYKAKQLCPHITIVNGHYDQYEIFRDKFLKIRHWPRTCNDPEMN